MQISKDAGRLLGRQGRRPAQGDRQEEPRGDGRARSPSSVEGCRANGVAAERHRLAVDDEREVGRLLVQQVPRRVLRADRLPHGVAEGQLPGRVHGRADLLGDGHQGQGAVLRRQGGGHGHRDPAARREPLRPRVRRRRRQHPLRPRRGEGRRLRGGRGDQGRARGGRARSQSIWDFCARVDPRAVNKRAIEALIKCGAFGSTGASRKGMLGVLEQAQAAGPEGPARRPDRPGVDLRPRRPGRRRRRRAASPFMAPPAPADPAARSSSRPSCWPSRRRPSGSSSPRTRSRRCARRCAPPVDAPLADAARAQATATGSRPAASSPQAKKIRTKKGDPMMFATLDDLEGSIEVLIFGKALAEYERRARRRRGRARARARRPRRQGHLAHRPDRRALPALAPRRSRRRARRPPSSREGPQPLTVRVDATALPATIIDELKHVFGNHAGESEVVLGDPDVGGPAHAAPGGGLPRQRRRRACAPSWAASSARRRSRSARPAPRLAGCA